MLVPTNWRIIGVRTFWIFLSHFCFATRTLIVFCILPADTTTPVYALEGKAMCCIVDKAALVAIVRFDVGRMMRFWIAMEGTG
jgi:hypothetical protein